MATRVKLLGRPSIARAGAELEPPREKSAALLLYLAYQSGWSSRDQLLGLFWPETAESTARSNLRSLLSRSVKRLPYAACLEIESARLRWQVPTDVSEFRRALDEQRWAEALRLYGGSLLEGFWLAAAPGFESWLETEREALHGAWRDAGFCLAGKLEASGQWVQAAEALSHILSSDPLDEEVLRQVVRNLHRGGQDARALAAAESFCRGLERELAIEPEPATLRLVEEVRASASARTAVRADLKSFSPRERRHNLPSPASALVGREAERARLGALLGDPGCRLATLVGPGGVGKTRLALALATDQTGRFADGVWWVSCISVPGPEQLVYAVAEALSLPLVGPAEPRRQLLEFVRSRETLLVLDNLEHLVPHLDLISEMLAVAPSLKVLATSRERLGLPGEHIFDLYGLIVPNRGVGGGADGDAVRLFVQCALRGRRDFALDSGNRQAVLRICGLVEGLPLAIEMAAGWLRVVSPADIAAEIERGIDILWAPVPDASERHQSIRAVFDYSWRVLTADEQRALRKLAVFQGGFERQAAERVAGAGLASLAGLVNKSFLTTTPGGRYCMHPLIQQYLREKLAGDPDEKAAVEAAHGTYFGTYLDTWRSGLLGQELLRAVRAVAADLANIRTAWRWALQHRRPDLISQLAPALGNFYMYRSRYQEWRDDFGEAAERLMAQERTERADLALAFLLVHLGWCNQRLGRFDDVEKAARLCQDVYGRLGLPPVPGPATDPALVLGLVACARGNYAAGAHHGEQALRTGMEQDHLHNQSVAYHVLAKAALARGRYVDGGRYAGKSYALAQQLGDRWHMTNCHIELGHAAMGLGNDAEAQRHFRSSYRMCEEFDDKGGMVKALNELGALALARQDYGGAKGTFERSLALNQAVHEGKGLATALCGMGDAALGIGEHGVSCRYYRQALELAVEMQAPPQLMSIARGVCLLLSRTGLADRARDLAAELRTYPAFAGLPGEPERRRLPGRLEEPEALSPESGADELKDDDLARVAALMNAELSLLTI